MKKLFSILIALLAFVTVKANDGAFYSQGNQLIPINETTIKVQKEILTITRVETGEGLHSFKVNVYYEFFNPGRAKDLLVGFEAVNYSEGGETHPYIHDFKVVMNNQELPYEVNRIFYPLDEDGNVRWGEMEGYYQNGRFVEPTQAMWRSLQDENSPYYVWDDDVPYYYVYHFNAHFNKGLNIIQHTYDFNGSDLVGEAYLFDYVLTAANRWANKGIDDFTLEINMGDHESFSVQPTFFQNADEWTFNGKGKASMREDMIMICENCPIFHVQSGSIVFHKKNFHPEGELHIARDGFYLYVFDYENDNPQYYSTIIDRFKSQYYNLTLEYTSFAEDKSSFTAEQRRIMKNIPFAYRGYVFEDQGLQRYFNSTKWYIPNPEYQADMTTMSKDEKEWILFWAN